MMLAIFQTLKTSVFSVKVSVNSLMLEAVYMSVITLELDTTHTRYEGPR